MAEEDRRLANVNQWLNNERTMEMMQIQMLRGRRNKTTITIYKDATPGGARARSRLPPPKPQELPAGEKVDSARLRRSRRFEGTLTHLHANIPSPMCRIHSDWPSSLLESSPAASAPRFTLHSLLVTTGSQRSFRFWLLVLPRRERAQQPPLSRRCNYPFPTSLLHVPFVDRHAL